ncbi:MAG TPA: histidine phosphatase family protein [Solirubrobacteraceae bacterium]|nr:histidine phosphatase family protein [Solirubrobacteraceae bacterium]
MRRLYLLRHAKSSWKETGIPDHDRPLAGRGRKASKAMARYLHEQRVRPELVLCSSATRARQTFERLEPLGAREVHIERELYAADAATLLARLRDVAAGVASVMLIGHNPGLEDLALVLARESPVRDDLVTKFPTAALATLAFTDRDWAALERGTAELVGFVRPRELAD